MKAILHGFIVLILIAPPARGQWEWSHPKPQGNEIYYIDFSDPQHGFATGGCGAILRSDNGGENWTRSENDVICEVLKFHFPSPPVGYAIARERKYYGDTGEMVLKTTDGGVHWSQVWQGNTSGFTGIWFTGDERGFTVGDEGILRKTTDGGANWSSYCLSYETDFQDIAFFDARTGIITGDDGALYRTVDGGNSWSRIQGIPGYNLGTIRITGPQSAHLVLAPEISYGGNPQPTVFLLTTDDSGLTWGSSADSLILPWNDYIYCADFPTRDTGFVYINPQLLRTTDGGSSWDTLISDLFPGHFRFLNGTTGFHQFAEPGSTGYGYGGVLSQIWKTDDRGETWYLTTDQASIAHFQAITFPSPNVGYVVGGTVQFQNNDGDILKTTDGGVSWYRPMASPLDATDLRACFFLDENTGYVGGRYGKLFKTTNGGQDWSLVFSDDGLIVSSIFFRNQDTGYVACSYGSGYSAESALITTCNGGADWDKVLYPDINYLDGVVFPSADTGFYIRGAPDVSWNSKVCRTIDQGQNWEVVASREGDRFSRLQFFDPLHGYALSLETLCKTSDGGNTWTVDSIEERTGYLFDMSFISPDTGYVVGSDGQILRTSDGGTTWRVQESGTRFDLTSVCYSSPSKLFAAGHFSVILSGDTASGVGFKEPNPATGTFHLKTYPNPAGESVTVSFELREAGLVNIDLFDVRGKRVDHFSYRTLTAGRHDIPLVTKTLAPGLYFCKISSLHSFATTRVIIHP